MKKKTVFQAVRSVEIPGEEKQSRQKHVDGQTVLVGKNAVRLIDPADMLDENDAEIDYDNRRDRVQQNVEIASAVLQVMVDGKKNQIDHHHLPQFEKGEKQILGIPQGRQTEQKIQHVQAAPPVGDEFHGSAQNEKRQHDGEGGDVNDGDLHAPGRPAVELLGEKIDGRPVEHEQRQDQHRHGPADPGAFTQQRDSGRQNGHHRGGEKQVLHTQN